MTSAILLGNLLQSGTWQKSNKLVIMFKPE